MTKLKNRVISIFDRKTSMRLANEEWVAFDDICKREGLKRKRLLEMIEQNKTPQIGLTCFVRLFTVVYMHRLAKLTVFKSKANDNNRDIYRTFDIIS